MNELKLTKLTNAQTSTRCNGCKILLWTNSIRPFASTVSGKDKENLILTNYLYSYQFQSQCSKHIFNLSTKNKIKWILNVPIHSVLRHKYKLKSQNGHWKTIFWLFDKVNFNVFPPSSSQRLLILNWATPHYTLNPVTSCFLALEIAEPGKNQEWSWILNHFHPHSYP